MTISHAFFLGLLEGITEFLPVSSTGHLILAGHALGLSDGISATFEVFIQLGAILAVVFCYFNRFVGLVLPQEGNTFSGLRGIVLLVLTTLPGAFLGLMLHDSIKSLFSPASVAVALVAGAACMIATENLMRMRDGTACVSSIDGLTWKMAAGIGIFQCLALWPGFSRSASTIMGGLILGLDKKTAADYSFMAAVPIIAGAAGYDLLKSMSMLSSSDVFPFFVGTAVSFLSAFAAMRFFISLLNKKGLVPFAVYRIVLAAFVYLFLIRQG